MVPPILLRLAALAVILLAGCTFQGAPGTGGNSFDGPRASLPAQLPDGTRILDLRFPIGSDGRFASVQVQWAEGAPSSTPRSDSLKKNDAFRSFRVRDVRGRGLTIGDPQGYIAGVLISEAVFESADGKIAFVLAETTGSKVVIFPPPQQPAATAGR